jgi:hypothetical protein
MSTRIVCNGCAATLRASWPDHEAGEKRLVVQFERVDGSGGVIPLDAGVTGHWCIDCTAVAFSAVAEYVRVALRGEPARPR